MKSLAQNKATISSENLILETLTQDNMSIDYCQWLLDHETIQYMEVRHHKQTPETVKNFVDAMWQSENDLLLGIFLKDGHKHIGNIKLGFVDWRHRRGDISLLIGDKNSRGKGYASEAVTALCDFAFHDLGLRRLEAGCYASNAASIATFKKAGFEHEGTLKGYCTLNDKPEDQIYLGKLA